MSTKDTFEKMARNTWLAGLGSINSSKDSLGKTIDAAQEKSNSLYDELVNRGEAIQNEISQKINKTRAEIEAKGKELFGFSSTNSKSQDEKIAELNTKVDALTTAVVALIEKREAAKKPAAKTRATNKAKTATKAKPAVSTKATAKSATKTTTTKPAAKKPASKTAAKPAAKKPAAKKPAAKTTTASKTNTAPKAENKDTADKK